jgi:hypothetical protein
VFQQGEIDSIGERVALTRRHLSSCTKSSSVRVAARLSWSRENIDGIIFSRPHYLLELVHRLICNWQMVPAYAHLRQLKEQKYQSPKERNIVR